MQAAQRTGAARSQHMCLTYLEVLRSREAVPCGGLPLTMCNFQAGLSCRAMCDLRSSDTSYYALRFHTHFADCSGGESLIDSVR